MKILWPSVSHLGGERAGLEQFKITCKRDTILKTEKVSTERASGKLRTESGGSVEN